MARKRYSGHRLRVFREFENVNPAPGQAHSITKLVRTHCEDDCRCGPCTGMVANFIYQQVAPLEPCRIVLTDRSTPSDEGTQIVLREWFVIDPNMQTFDRLIGTGASLTTTDIGFHHIKLVVTDNRGCQASITRTVNCNGLGCCSNRDPSRPVTVTWSDQYTSLDVVPCSEGSHFAFEAGSVEVFLVNGSGRSAPFTNRGQSGWRISVSLCASLSREDNIALGYPVNVPGHVGAIIGAGYGRFFADRGTDINRDRGASCDSFGDFRLINSGIFCNTPDASMTG